MTLSAKAQRRPADAEYSGEFFRLLGPGAAESSPPTGAKIAVATPPGQMAFTLIPRSASSRATDFVNPTTPNLAAV